VNPLFSQSAPVVPVHVYGLKDPGNEAGKVCGQCRGIIKKRLKETGIGFYVDEKKDVYFVFTDAEYLKK
jgi:hypothetical protein